MGYIPLNLYSFGTSSLLLFKLNGVLRGTSKDCADCWFWVVSLLSLLPSEVAGLRFSKLRNGGILMRS